MADIYERYANLKQKIEDAKEELKVLEPKILEEIKSLSQPMSTDFGKFTTVSRKRYNFSEGLKKTEKKIREKIKLYAEPLEGEIEKIKEAEIETGVAEVEESLSVRFVPRKDK